MGSKRLIPKFTAGERHHKFVYGEIRQRQRTGTIIEGHVDACVQCGYPFDAREEVVMVNVLKQVFKMYKYKGKPKVRWNYVIKPIAKVLREWVIDAFCSQGCFDKYFHTKEEEYTWLRISQLLQPQLSKIAKQKHQHPREFLASLEKELKTVKT